MQLSEAVVGRGLHNWLHNCCRTGALCPALRPPIRTQSKGGRRDSCVSIAQCLGAVSSRSRSFLRLHDGKFRLRCRNCSRFSFCERHRTRLSFKSRATIPSRLPISCLLLLCATSQPLLTQSTKLTFISNHEEFLFLCDRRQKVILG